MVKGWRDSSPSAPWTTSYLANMVGWTIRILTTRNGMRDRVQPAVVTWPSHFITFHLQCYTSCIILYITSGFMDINILFISNLNMVSDQFSRELSQMTKFLMLIISKNSLLNLVSKTRNKNISRNFRWLNYFSVSISFIVIIHSVVRYHFMNTKS